MATATARKPKSTQTKSYDNKNRGALFPQDKADNDRRPDYTGKLKLDPEAFEIGEDGLIEVRLAAWRSESDRVGEYFSLIASSPQRKE